jgi:hypothetical protein
LTALEAQNRQAAQQLTVVAEQPDRLAAQADELQQQGASTVAASTALEERVHGAQRHYAGGMQAVPAARMAGTALGVQRQADEESRYEQRTDLDLAGRVSSALPLVVTGTDQPPSQAARQEDQARETRRRQEEISGIETEAGGHFERLGAGEKALIALKLTGRHLYRSVGDVSWPQFAGHVARGLVDPRVSLMGVVSGLSMALSGLANLGNVEEWKRAPVGNLLKSAADVATGITIILASIIGLAIAVLALAWAAAILTFGLLGGLAAVVTPFAPPSSRPSPPGPCSPPSGHSR